MGIYDNRLAVMHICTGTGGEGRHQFSLLGKDVSRNGFPKEKKRERESIQPEEGCWCAVFQVEKRASAKVQGLARGRGSTWHIWCPRTRSV